MERTCRPTGELPPPLSLSLAPSLIPWRGRWVEVSPGDRLELGNTEFLVALGS
jgi:hypothetical protein